jgi:DNA polymerase
VDGVLHIDFETRSAIDLTKAGAYRYAEDPSTDIVCSCQSFGDEPEVSAWLRSDPVPERVAMHVVSGGLLVAHNKDFERILWRYVLTPRYGWPEPALEQWRCTAAKAAYMALPRSLGEAAYVMGVTEQKDEEGHRLMKQMCRPRKILTPDMPDYLYWDEKLGAETRSWDATRMPDGSIILWVYTPQKMARELEYCKQDVRTERALDKKVPDLPERELAVFFLDMKINDRGLRIDVPTVIHCRSVAKSCYAELSNEMEVLTGRYCKPSMVGAIADWLNREGVRTADGKEITSIAAEPLEQLLAQEGLPAHVKRVLEIRDEAARTSTSKFDSMLLRRNLDGRARGNFMLYGAHTTRWSGTGFQPQNLMRPTGDVDIRYALKLLMEGADADWLEMLIGAPAMQVVAECMRGMICADPGKEFITADFSNIEGRVNAWLHDELWKVQAFRDYDTIIGYDLSGEPIRKGRDLYLLAAEGINEVPAGTYNKKSPERQHGKVAELSMGYQGGINAFTNMGKNYHVHVPPKKANQIKIGWRKQHPNIEQGWADLDDAALNAVSDPGTAYWACNHRIGFAVHGLFLYMRVPSGDTLKYCRPEIRKARKMITVIDEATGEPVRKVMEREAVSYWGPEGSSRRWTRKYGYGGHWDENAVQKISRDLLVHGMLKVEADGYPLVLHSHDEAVSEVEKGFGDLDAYCKTLAQLPGWGDGCPVVAEGWRGERYRK